MGSIIFGLVTQTLNFAKGIEQEKNRERNRKLQKQADKLANPIKPPHFWKNIKDRKRKVPDGPYSVEGIRMSLSDVILPVGYSEEQLINVGFEKEVDGYRAKVNKERKELFEAFSSTVKKMTDAIRAELTGDDIPLRRALSRAGVTEKKIAQFEDIAGQAKRGEITAASLDASLGEIRTKLAQASAEQEAVAKFAEVQSQINVASDARDSALLGITRRAIASRLGLKPPPASSQPTPPTAQSAQS